LFRVLFVLNHDDMREQWKTGVIGDPQDKAGGVLGRMQEVEDHRLPASFTTSLFVVVYFKTSSTFFHSLLLTSSSTRTAPTGRMEG
jgi:hypothetical protein